MASVTREETEGGEVEVYPIAEIGAGPERTESQNSQAQSQRAITAPKKRSWTKKAKPVASASLDVTPRTTHSESQTSASKRTGPDDSVISGETG